jgi:uroporphyrinogen-III synthase
MIKVLSTKQLDDKTIAYAKSLNFEVTCVEFIEVTPVLWNESMLKDFDCDSVAFTSSSGVKYFFDHPDTREWVKTKNVFSIAGKTFDELAKLDIDVVSTAQDSRAMTEGVIEKKITDCILHVCGNLRLDTLEKQLSQAGIRYYPLEVYNTKLITGLHLEEKFDVILFFSPSGVEGFLSGNEIGEKTICCCIGGATANRLKQSVPNAKIMVSPFPSPMSMLERIDTYFKTSGK